MIDYVATLTVAITELDGETGSTKTVVRKVSTGHFKGLAAAKAAYDSFVSDLRGYSYTEDDTTETSRRHVGDSGGP